MPSHFDTRESRTPEARAADIAAVLPAQIARAKALPGYADSLSGVDPEGTRSLADLAALPVLRKSALVEMQKGKGANHSSEFEGGRFAKEISAEKYEALHKSILSGFISNIAQKKEKNFYRAARGREVMIFPGSGLFDKAKNFVFRFEWMSKRKARY